MPFLFADVISACGSVLDMSQPSTLTLTYDTDFGDIDALERKNLVQQGKTKAVIQLANERQLVSLGRWQWHSRYIAALELSASTLTNQCRNQQRFVTSDELINNECICLFKADHSIDWACSRFKVQNGGKPTVGCQDGCARYLESCIRPSPWPVSLMDSWHSLFWILS